MAEGWHGESKRHSLAKKYGSAGSKKTKISDLNSQAEFVVENGIMKCSRCGQIVEQGFEDIHVCDVFEDKLSKLDFSGAPSETLEDIVLDKTASAGA